MFGLTLINVRKGLLGKVSRSTYIMELFVETSLGGQLANVGTKSYEKCSKLRRK